MKTAKFHAEGSLICRVLRGFIHHREFILLLQFSNVAHVGSSKLWTLFASGSVERKNGKDFHQAYLSNTRTTWRIWILLYRLSWICWGGNARRAQ